MVSASFKYSTSPDQQRRPLSAFLYLSSFYDVQAKLQPVLKGLTSLDPRELDQEAAAFSRRYILSTGGARGQPGVGIFIVGPYIGQGLVILYVPLLHRLFYAKFTNLSSEWKVG